MRALRERLHESFRAFSGVATNPDLRRLQLALVGSDLGGWAYFVGVSVYAYRSGGATAVGLLGVARWGSAALLLPWLSLLADRYPRQLVMVASDLLRAASLGGAALVAFAGGPAFGVYVLCVFASISGTLFRPAEAALLPTIARTPEELTAANVASTSIDSVGLFAGPGLGGLLLAVSSPGLVFAVTAATHIWSALMVVRIRPSKDSEQASETEEVEPERLGSALLAGFTAIGRSPGLRVVVGLLAAQMIVDGALSVLVVVVALNLVGLGSGGVGWLNSAVGIGGLVGAVVAAALIGRKRLAGDFGLGILLWGVPLVLVGAFPNGGLAIALFAVLGLGNTLAETAGTTLLQRSAPDEVMGRVFGVLDSITLLAISIGAAVTPALLSWLGTRTTLIVGGALLPVLVLLSARRLRAIDAASAVPERQLSLLRAIPIFAPLPGPTLERLAFALERVTVAEGTPVFAQGDRGDRFYVIDSGRARVDVDGQPVRELGPGDFFGEIALLRDLPRTATVLAVEPLELYALDRDDFLAAVTGYAPSLEAAESVVGARLAGAALPY